jgi:hypothetical protein
LWINGCVALGNLRSASIASYAATVASAAAASASATDDLGEAASAAGDLGEAAACAVATMMPVAARDQWQCDEPPFKKPFSA